MILPAFLLTTTLINASHHQLIQRIFNNPCRARSFQLGNHIANDAFFQDRVDRYPFLVAQLRYGGAVQGRQDLEYSLQVLLADIKHQSHTSLCIDCATQHQRDVLDLPLLLRILPCIFVGYELRIGLADCLDYPQAIGLERAAGFCDLDDGIGQDGGLDLCRSPRELDFYGNVFVREVVLGCTHQFGSDNASAEVFRFVVLRIFGDSQHPAHLAAALFRINEIANRVYFQPTLDHPITPGKSSIEEAVLNVARHLLSTNQHAFDLRIVDLGEVRP